MGKRRRSKDRVERMFSVRTLYYTEGKDLYMPCKNMIQAFFSPGPRDAIMIAESRDDIRRAIEELVFYLSVTSLDVLTDDSKMFCGPVNERFCVQWRSMPWFSLSCTSRDVFQEWLNILSDMADHLRKNMPLSSIQEVIKDGSFAEAQNEEDEVVGTKKGARRRNINYNIAPSLTEDEILWNDLKSFASEYDVEVEDHDEAFFLCSMGRAIAFSRNEEGIKQASDWIEKEVVPKYDNREWHERGYV